MKCPIDNETLVVSDRNNTEIDYCPTCRGVWLDRGELDKIIERSDNFNKQHDSYRKPERRDHDDYRPQYNNQQQPKKKRKESFLGDLFEF